MESTIMLAADAFKGIQYSTMGGHYQTLSPILYEQPMLLTDPSTY